MTPHLALCVALLIWQDISIERVAVEAEPERRCEVVLETAANSRNGGIAQGARGFGCRGARTHVDIVCRLIHDDGSPWTKAEFVRVLLGGEDRETKRPRVGFGLVALDSQNRATRLHGYVVADEPRFEGNIGLSSRSQHRLALALIAENVLLASTPWQPGSGIVAIRYEPSSFPGYARSVEFRLVDASRSVIPRNTRIELRRTDARGTAPDGLHTAFTRNYYVPGLTPNARWIVAGDYDLMVVPEHFSKLLPCAGKVEVPACAHIRVDLVADTPVTLQLVPAPEDRLRLFHTNSILVIDERGFEHRLDARDARHMLLHPSDQDFEMKVALHPHEYLGAPRGNLSLVVGSNVIPIRVQQDPEIVHLPKLAPAKTVEILVGPFDPASPPGRVDVRIFTSNGVRIVTKSAGDSGGNDRPIDHEWFDWSVTLPLGSSRFDVMIDHQLAKSEYVTVEDREGFEVELRLDR